MGSSHIPADLLSEAEVLAALKKEVEFTSLTATAHEYDIQLSQLSDVLRGKAQLSKRMIRRLKLKLHKYYERVDDGADSTLDSL